MVCTLPAVVNLPSRQELSLFLEMPSMSEKISKKSIEPSLRVISVHD